MMCLQKELKNGRGKNSATRTAQEKQAITKCFCGCGCMGVIAWVRKKEMYEWGSLDCCSRVCVCVCVGQPPLLK